MLEIKHCPTCNFLDRSADICVVLVVGILCAYCNTGSAICCWTALYRLWGAAQTGAYWAELRAVYYYFFLLGATFVVILRLSFSHRVYLMLIYCASFWSLILQAKQAAHSCFSHGFGLKSSKGGCVVSLSRTWTNKTYFPHFRQLIEDFIRNKPASWSWPVTLCWLLIEARSQC